MKNLRTIEIQDKTLCDIETYLAIQKKDENIGQSTNTAYILLPTQNNRASINIKVTSTDIIAINITKAITAIGSCGFALWRNKFNYTTKQYEPFELIKVLTINPAINATNNIFVIESIAGNYSIVKDFSQGIEIGITASYSNYDVINNIMLQGIANKWSR